jgi:hypothetical protein
LGVGIDVSVPDAPRLDLKGGGFSMLAGEDTENWARCGGAYRLGITKGGTSYLCLPTNITKGKWKPLWSFPGYPEAHIYNRAYIK